MLPKYEQVRACYILSYIVMCFNYLYVVLHVTSFQTPVFLKLSLIHLLTGLDQVLQTVHIV